MGCNRDRSLGFRYATALVGLGVRVFTRGGGATALLVAGAVSAAEGAQQSAVAARSLVLDGVNVVDVEQGRILSNQRVVIVNNRIQTVGGADTVGILQGANVVAAQGKYLIPGLWDMHTHSMRHADIFYPLFLANGVTGIRDGGSEVPTDTLRRWRQEILAGARVGPPRQLLSGGSINEMGFMWESFCRNWPMQGSPFAPCVADSAGAVRLVDSLKAAGVDMIKIRAVARPTYFTIAAHARRLGIAFGGHAQAETAIEVSDSGASIIDHMDAGDLDAQCLWDSPPMIVQFRNMAAQRTPTYAASVEQCRTVAERFARNGTWWVPTMLFHTDISGPHAEPIIARLEDYTKKFWSESVPNPYASDTTGGAAPYAVTPPDTSDAPGLLQIAQEAGLPILAGTDVSPDSALQAALPGFNLHAELAIYVAEGLTPLNALQSATLNPAKLLHATDSLGSVAPGKLADLVLLDANPLVDITNTTAIRAVIANGRYFDRAALDGLLTQAQAKRKQKP